MYKKLVIAAAPLVLCGCFSNIVPRTPPQSGIVIADRLAKEPALALAYDPGSERAFFAWTSLSGEPGPGISVFSADAFGNVEKLGSGPEAGLNGVARFEPGLSVSSGSVYASWLERSSGTLSLNAAVYSLRGGAAKEFKVSDLLSYIKNRSVLIPSGEDSAFLAWEDFNPSAKVSFMGIAALGPEGYRWKKQLGNGVESGQYMAPAVIADGEGGVLAAFRRIDSGDRGIVLNHFDRNGSSCEESTDANTLGPYICVVRDDAITANVDVGYQSGPKIAKDDNDGTFVIWENGRNGNINVYGQKLSTGGVSLWDEDGVHLSASPGNQWDPALAPDGAGGFFSAWIDDHNGSKWELKLQHIDEDGDPAWGPDAVTVFPSDARQSEPSLVPDGEGGVIITWNETRYGYLDVFAQRFSFEGARLWLADGVPVTAANGDQLSPRLAADGVGGCLIAWKHPAEPGNWKIRAQRLDANGAPLWPAAAGPAGGSGRK